MPNRKHSVRLIELRETKTAIQSKNQANILQFFTFYTCSRKRIKDWVASTLQTKAFVSIIMNRYLHLFFFFYHFSSCQDDVVPGTRSIFDLKGVVKSNCQAALSDGVVSLTHLSVKEKVWCQSQIQELRGADLHDMSLSARAEMSDEHSSALALKFAGLCLLSNKVTDTVGHFHLDNCSLSLLYSVI